MNLEPVLREFGFLEVQRPPLLWDVDTDRERLIPLLQAMVSEALSRSARPETLTLNASNIVVDEDAGPSIPHGEFVGLTLNGHDGREPDGTWPGTSPLLQSMDGLLRAAGARYAYVRSVRGKGSITVLLPRKSNSGSGP